MIKRVDKRLQAVQCLTGNKIKIIACITMLIDHFSKIFLESIMNDKLFPLYLAGGMSTEQFYGIDAFQKNILNGIGTIAFPLFCLLLSEGFFYGVVKEACPGALQEPPGQAIITVKIGNKMY